MRKEIIFFIATSHFDGFVIEAFMILSLDQGICWLHAAAGDQMRMSSDPEVRVSLFIV